MRRFSLAALTLSLAVVFALALTFAYVSFADHHEKGAKDDGKMMEGVHKDDVTLKGTLYCLLPGKGGEVQTIVSAGPCDHLGPHAHVLLVEREQEGYVYAVQGSEEAITKMEKRTGDRKNFELKGKVGGSQRAWTITVD
ncbi:MAG: hypothetical protein IH874_02500 [Candidatus Dadabacteria bacterium]|nr:hypothetical protein [Candidatus Dadabacteria bacterium]